MTTPRPLSDAERDELEIDRAEMVVEEILGPTEVLSDRIHKKEGSDGQGV